MRDLEKDLELCEKIPGPWVLIEKQQPSTDDHGWRQIAETHDMMVAANVDDLFRVLGPEPTLEKVRALRRTILEFIAQSQEGWPEAIRRALAAEAEVERLRPIYEAYRELSRLKDESRNECPECLEERCRNLHPGAGCSKHLQAITIAECNLHNAVNDVGRYEESHGIGGDPT